MNIANLTKASVKSILLNKLRVFLTMLGVIIGVASVITMLAIGEGTKQNIKEQISTMGANTITISPQHRQSSGAMQDNSSSRALTVNDIQFIENNATLIKDISPVITTNGQAISSYNNYKTTLYGVSSSYLDINALKLADGIIFGNNDVLKYNKVCVIGKTLVDELYPNENPIGKTIRFNSIPFLIIGVLESKGDSFGRDRDNTILAPYTAIQKRITRTDYLQQIIASARSEEVARDAEEELVELLRKLHNLSDDTEDDFTVRSQQEILDTISSTTDTIGALLVAVAGISLIIGGIGIMNIMYVSVKERTREIGLRMAVGATGKDILRQFLLESVIISITGGVIGILISFIITYSIKTWGGWPTEISFSSIIISFIICTATGIFFGLYPAIKASKLDPITALRYE